MHVYHNITGFVINITCTNHIEVKPANYKIESHKVMV